MSLAHPRHSEWWLPLTFGAAVMLFVAATVFTDVRARDIDRAAVGISGNAAPSILYLAAARADVRQLQLVLAQTLQGERTPAAGAAELRNILGDLDRSVRGNAGLPTFPGENDLWARVAVRLGTLETVMSQIVERLDAGDLPRVRELAMRDLPTAAEASTEGIGEAIELNARDAEVLADRIETLRRRWRITAFTLDAVIACITFLIALRLMRAQRAHTRLVASHQKIIEERAGELEQFSGRVAHDILSPLATVAMALPYAARDDVDPRVRREMVARGERSLARVRTIVDGLLGFARAGAHPAPDARSDVCEVVDELVAELRPDAQSAGVELVNDCAAAPPVACNRGVLTSLLANLVLNAIKYIGDGPVRRVTIRAFARGERVHVDVQDTGPGLQPGMEKRLFEPYARGHHPGQPGIGLGLATVKRIVDAHCGAVGVDSRVGIGARFWFELPSARPAPTFSPVHTPAGQPS